MQVRLRLDADNRKMPTYQYKYCSECIYRRIYLYLCDRVVLHPALSEVCQGEWLRTSRGRNPGKALI